jgi:peroxiredoxin family protein
MMITTDSTLEEIQMIKEDVELLKAKTSGLQTNKMAMLCFSGDLDKILAAFILATGAAAMDMKVMMFFSFWGCTALRKKKARAKGKDIFGKMFGFMLPKGADKIKLSNMNMGGMGTGMMKYLMKKKNVDSLPEMIKTAESMGVEIYVCEMSMEIMGMKREEIIPYKGLQFAGAGKFLQEAAGTEMNFFI